MAGRELVRSGNECEGPRWAGQGKLLLTRAGKVRERGQEGNLLCFESRMSRFRVAHVVHNVSWRWQMYLEKSRKSSQLQVGWQVFTPLPTLPLFFIEKSEFLTYG